MANNKNLDNVLTELRNFIRSLSDAKPISSSSDFNPEIIISSAENGTLFLSSESAESYRRCLHGIIEIATKSDQTSPKAVEKLVQHAVLTSLDIRERFRDRPFDQRIDRAIQELKKALKVKPFPFQIYYPIGGLAKAGLPTKFGKVLFCIFDDEQIAHFQEVLKRQGIPPEEALRHPFINEIMKSDIVGEPIGLVEVFATESEAARTLTLKDLQLTVDALNFYSDLIPYPEGYVFLVGDKERTRISIPGLAMGDKPSFNFSERMVGPLRPLSLQAIQEADTKYGLGFSTVSALLAKNRNRFEDKLIASIQWAGRATVEERKEEAFLLYAIALESLILVENDRDELLYRLRIRIAHLLGSDFHTRREISTRVRDLYGIRSKIVHSGKYQVTDKDLNLMRFITKECILRILTGEPFVSMTKPDNLVDWFDEQIL